VCFENAFNTFKYVEICFDDGLCDLGYEYKKWEWDMIYEIYDEWRISWNVCSIMKVICCWKHEYEIKSMISFIVWSISIIMYKEIKEPKLPPQYNVKGAKVTFIVNNMSRSCLLLWWYAW